MKSRALSVRRSPKLQGKEFNRESIRAPGYAGIAQLVEQLIRNEQAAGSSPITSSKKPF